MYEKVLTRFSLLWYFGNYGKRNNHNKQSWRDAISKRNETSRVF